MYTTLSIWTFTCSCTITHDPPNWFGNISSWTLTWASFYIQFGQLVMGGFRFNCLFTEQLRDTSEERPLWTSRGATPRWVCYTHQPRFPYLKNSGTGNFFSQNSSFRYPWWKSELTFLYVILKLFVYLVLWPVNIFVVHETCWSVIFCNVFVLFCITVRLC